jgi:hypothetical protein
MSTLVDRTGQKFGRWIVLGRADISGAVHWKCRCECGTEKSIRGNDLHSSSSKSCGCWRKELFVASSTKHGACFTPEYNSWAAMKDRCNNQNDKDYHRYGGRGISVCKRWLNSFENFFADMGLKPSPKHTLDRYPNNDGNYKPTNCRWATSKQQAATRRPQRSYYRSDGQYVKGRRT